MPRVIYMRQIEVEEDRIVFERSITRRSDGSGNLLCLPRFIKASSAKIVYYPQENKLEVFLKR